MAKSENMNKKNKKIKIINKFVIVFLFILVSGIVCNKSQSEEIENKMYSTSQNLKEDKADDVFQDVIASYSTSYNENNYDRSTNIKISAEKINNLIIMPGDEFSFNKILGERTQEAGYKKAPAYVNGNVVNEYGGGICQTSSTLYNAVILSNMSVTERKNHFYISSYVPICLDATVSWEFIDFKFVNNKKKPIKIISSAQNGKLQINIMGKKEENIDCMIESKVLWTIKYNVKYEYDETLKPSEEKLIQDGEDGYVGEAYRTIEKDGKTLYKTIISRDIYNAKNKIIKIGK